MNPRTLKKLEEIFRKAYVIRKNESVNRIMGRYDEVSRLIANRVAVSPYAKSPTTARQLIMEIDDMLIESTPLIEAEYSNGADDMFSLATSNSTAIVSGLEASSGLFSSFSNASSIIKNEMFVSGSLLDGKTISDKIWSVDKRADVAQTVIKAIQEGKSTNDLALELEKYLVEGAGHSKAYSLAYNEMGYAYSTDKLEQARLSNADDLGMTFAIKQSLSPMHNIYDICDILAATYRADGPVPVNPRHPRCNCIQEEVILSKRTATTTYEDQLKKFDTTIKKKKVNTDVTLL